MVVNAAALAVSLAISGMSPALPPAGEVVGQMIAHDEEQHAPLHRYTATRHYVVENRSHNKRAEMLVRLTRQQDGSKEFEVLDQNGWAWALNHIFPRLLEAEVEASRPDVREQSRITPANYNFNLLGTELVRGRRTYVLAIEPKTRNKYLTRGRIWVDADEYAIIRLEGSPSVKPSFWIKNIQFVHEYDKQGRCWLPTADHSVTDVRIFGPTEISIEYFDYVMDTTPLVASSKVMRR